MTSPETPDDVPAGPDRDDTEVAPDEPATSETPAAPEAPAASEAPESSAAPAASAASAVSAAAVDRMVSSAILDRAGKADRKPAVLIAQLVVAVVLVVGLLGFAMPRLLGTSWSEIGSTLAGVPVPTLLICLVLELVVMVLWAVQFRAALPGVRYGTALQAHMTSNALNSGVPFGGPLSLAAMLAMLRPAGFGVVAIALALTLTGLVDTIVRVALPFVAMLLLTAAGEELPTGILVAAVIAGVLGLLVIALVIAVGASDRATRAVAEPLQDTARQVWGLIGRDPAAVDLVEGASALRRRAVGIVGGRWAALTAPALVEPVLQATVFVLCARAVGVDLVLPVLAACWVLGRLLATIQITPSGVGIVETGTAAALVFFGAGPGAAAAAALLYTLFVVVLPLPFGAAAGLSWWTGRRKVRRGA